MEILAVLFIVFVVLFIVLSIVGAVLSSVLSILGTILTAVFPYVTGLGLLVLVIFLVKKTGEILVECFRTLNQSFDIFREKKKSLRLINQKYLGDLKFSVESCIFIPKKRTI